MSAGGVTSTTSWSNISEEWSYPSPTASLLIEGDMWFNTTASALKVYGAAAGVPAGTWASGGDMNTGRGSMAPSQAGSQTAAMASAGGGPSNVANVEKYNGTTWTETTDVNTARQGLGGSGTTTAALIFGGNGPVLVTESWDNSSWTEVSDLNTAPGSSATGAGTQTAAIRIGGYPVSSTTETWNGSSWTEVSELNTARGGGAAVGTTTAATFAGGGYPQPSVGANVEQWDGSSWTEIANITARSDNGAAGTKNLMLVMGGSPNTTEFWNGSSWTELADMATAREGQRGCGTSVAGDAFGGGPNKTATEEFTADATISTVTTS